MSLQSWYDAFYPVPATRAVASAREALAHSLLKWQGLRAENLAAHDVTSSSVYVRGSADDTTMPALSIGATSCALCHMFLDVRRNGRKEVRCENCPLRKVRKLPCDVSYATSGSYSRSPWAEWVSGETPEPMINLIEKAIELTAKES